MQIKQFFLLICLLSSIILGATETPNPSTVPTTLTNDGGPECDLPAPFFFHVESIGSTWVTLGWGGNVMYQHRIRIYRQSDNALLSTTIVPAATGNATVSIPFDTPVVAVINAICLDGSHSPNTAVNAFQGVILELIVNGFQGSGTSNCYFTNFTSNKSCDFDGTDIATFQISLNGLYPKIFGVQATYDNKSNLSYKVYLPNTNSGNNNTYSFYCGAHTSPTPDHNCETPAVKVTFWQNSVETTIAYLDIYDGGVNELSGNLYDYNGTYCRIDKLGPAPGNRPPDPSGDRDGNSSSSVQPATAAPNPFNDQLDVFLPPTAEKVQLQLFNLSGQKVMDQQFAGRQEQYSLPTTNLATGFYLLRIEADGEVQTLKVIKSE